MNKACYHSGLEINMFVKMTFKGLLNMENGRSRNQYDQVYAS